MKGKHMKTIWKSVCMAGIFLNDFVMSGRSQRSDSFWRREKKSEPGGKEMERVFRPSMIPESLKADASYGFKLKATDQTKTIVTKGKKSEKLPDLELPSNLKKFSLV